MAITLLCGAATAAAGPIYFLGLTVPHAARAICGPDQRWVLVLSAVFGAVLMLLADVVGRVLVRPAELQAGIMLAFVGAPLFIALVRRQASRRSDASRVAGAAAVRIGERALAAGAAPPRRR